MCSSEVIVPCSFLSTISDNEIENVEYATGAKIQVNPDADSTSPNSCAVIQGTRNEVDSAKHIISDLVRLPSIEPLLDDFLQQKDVTLPVQLTTCSLDYYNYVTGLDNPKGWRFNWEDGKFIVEEVNSAPHAIAKVHLGSAVHRCLGKYISYCGGAGELTVAGCMTSFGKKLHADINWWLSRQSGPCIIAEIIRSKIDPDYIRNKLQSWFFEFPNLNEAMIISIQACSGTRWARVYRRSDENMGQQLYTCVQHVEFGDCEKPGEKCLNLSLVKIFGSEDNIPSDLKEEYPDNITRIDLHEVNKGVSYGESMEVEQRKWFEAQKSRNSSNDDNDRDGSSIGQDGSSSNNNGAD